MKTTKPRRPRATKPTLARVERLIRAARFDIVIAIHNAVWVAGGRVDGPSRAFAEQIAERLDALARRIARGEA